MLTVEARTHIVITHLLTLLPKVARDLINEHHDMSQQANQFFADNPDAMAAHQPLWHQHGIITHSKLFQECLEYKVPQYLKEWGVSETIESHFNQKIDGVTRWQLFQIFAILHDIGKFTARHISPRADGTVKRHFGDHEKHSGKLIREVMHDHLIKLGLTKAQIEYIARCGERHFDLGIVREAAKPHYTIAFTHSEAFNRKVQKIIKANPDLALEIFVSFLADSISKLDHFAVSTSDEAIPSERAHLEQWLAKNQLPPTLINGALQMPVNVAVTKQAIRLWIQNATK